MSLDLIVAELGGVLLVLLGGALVVFQVVSLLGEVTLLLG